jgi:predicted secreted protein
MALSLTFTGFVEEVKSFSWGSVVTVSHSNRQKNDAGQWETTSRDYIDISVEPGSEFDWLLSAQKGLRIAATGNAKISTYDKKDGSTGIRIKLWPKEIDTVESRAVDSSDVPF